MSDIANRISPITTNHKNIIISVDAMGGDNGPAAIVSGMANSAKTNINLRFIVNGNKTILNQLISKRKILKNICEIRHSKDIISMDDKPTHAMRNGKESSMWGTIEAVKNKDAHAAVSCGNTGALMAISTIRLRKLPGVYRPAIAILWPSSNSLGFNFMLDVGADIRADAPDLLKYALMGASYARNGFGLVRPRVGLLNVGTEEHKGRLELKEANDLISESVENGEYEYVGFVEGNDIPSNRVDVIVTDGFTGNIALKTGEGTASMIGAAMRESFKATFLSKLCAIFAIVPLKRFSKKIDPRRKNGGVFLGLNGTVVKSHGAADATGITAAINLAIQLAEMSFNEKLAARVASAAIGSDGSEKQ
ncbi:phosphate acyltransferase PlsX [Amylibacter sp.]|jgi:glycerol-3-phosphate acyltransferase PlsX|nr:phosphate acyltransferase PlsX [Amylibacter sp.]MDC1420418.1 phosphate acyltransferase PlsX [bacterium]MDB4017618.1 phosphate acyltransferase PlsX [Amylibacter sp.]MDB9892169.1 phosphate acyltransferase PlsX [Amylibacter sp.]MDC0096482.1 phosphate acyltransferase PlsX [Amylibacter sp.]|tara:strand:+ start:199 stop:1290 length:1092 start_codon:yes stop_codon:yes gene_type:complete